MKDKGAWGLCGEREEERMSEEFNVKECEEKNREHKGEEEGEE